MPANNHQLKDGPPTRGNDRLRKSMLALNGEFAAAAPIDSPETPVEVGGPKGPDPTRYGDWERKGRCIDF